MEERSRYPWHRRPQMLLQSCILLVLMICWLCRLQVIRRLRLTESILLLRYSAANTTSSAIWLVNAGEGKVATPWQVTSGEQHDFAARWSPDGRTLAFLSDRGGTPQVYLLPLSGGEARQLSNLPQG